jgi:adenosylhomocysteine nucleosidase
MLALVSAMAQELDALRPLLEAPVTVTVGGRRFETGLLHGEPVVLVLTGIGKVAAAATTVQLIERFGATRLVFTGVAGGLGEGVRVGDLVIGDELLQHDLDVSPLFPRHEVPLLGLSRLPADAALSMALARAAVEVAADPARHFGREAADLGVRVPRVHRGLIVSGDRFVATAAESRRLQAELPDALAVEMEGAAVAQVCHGYGLPFAVLRTVSDRADDDAHADFSRFIEVVARRATAAVIGTWLGER